MTDKGDDKWKYISRIQTYQELILNSNNELLHMSTNIDYYAHFNVLQIFSIYYYAHFYFQFISK